MSTKLKKNFQKGFTMVDNEIITSPVIDFKTLGIYLYLLSKPDNWDFSLANIAKSKDVGVDSVRTGINLLEKLGLLIRTPNKNQEGKFQGYNYEIYDTIDTNRFNKLKKPSLDYPTTDKPMTENTHTISNKENSKKESSKKEEEKEEKLQPTFSIKKVKTLEDEIKEYLENKIPILAECPQLRNIVEAIESKAKEDYKEYIDFVYLKKLNDGVKLFDQRAWNIWYFNDFYAQKKVVQTSQANSMPSANVAYAWQLEMIAEYNEKLKNQI